MVCTQGRAVTGYRLAPAAQADLDEIWDYIAADSPSAAGRLITSIHDRLNLLVEFPRLGSPREDLCPGLRSIRVGKYLLFYRHLAECIELVRVFHGARDVPR